ncbi:MAG: glycoside hydrolase family 26 protein [Bacteroidetes bacterium]|nr:glycoside hydrolase family 26 protein [Bacteroidota bacterium]
MYKRKNRLFIVLISCSIFILNACSTSEKGITETEKPFEKTNDFLVDHYATNETLALYNNLKIVTQNAVLFGHQDDTAYGVGWNTVLGRSDVKEVCGDYPAVYGWDLGDIGNKSNLDGVNFENMKRWIREAYSRGGINTISMHLDNPVTGNNAWDNSPAVAAILPGGSHHNNYISTLKNVADFMKDIKTSNGENIPILFRPYHEHNQTWSWWGKSACTSDEYNQLWQMTVEYLRDTMEVHNLLYIISPQDLSDQFDYFERYPGDDYVDIFGLDYYQLTNPASITKLGKSLDIIASLAESRGKISALTEVGNEKLTIDNWYTDYLLKALMYNENSKKTAWCLAWRNSNSSHYFVPYPGEKSVMNFVQFYNDPFTIFENDLPDMYK